MGEGLAFRVSKQDCIAQNRRLFEDGCQAVGQVQGLHVLLLQEVHPCASLGTEEQLVLPGYGVEAVLKNMEYSAMDDKSKADAAAAAAKKAAAAGNKGDDPLSGVDLSELGDVKGFKFDVLAKRKPELMQELMTFRDVLMSSDEEESIKVGLLQCPLQYAVAYISL